MSAFETTKEDCSNKVGDLIGDVITAEDDSSAQFESSSSTETFNPTTQLAIEELATFIANGYRRFLENTLEPLKSTFIIGMTGGVSVGKSTFAKQLKTLLADHSHGSLVTTVISSDGFLKSNKKLESESLSHRKGFPESYEIDHIERFLSNVRNGTGLVVHSDGRKIIAVPEYDHLIYDVKPIPVDLELPNILLFEGVNVLQFSQYCDLTIYIDADEPCMRQWFMTRVMDLRKKSETDPSAEFYRQFSSMTEDEFYHFAEGVWESINLKNLIDNIEPMREMAAIVVEKNKDHSIKSVAYK